MMFELLQSVVDWLVSNDVSSVVQYALFGIGGSKSKQKSFAESADQSVSSSSNRSRTSATSRQSIAFEDVFARLYGTAEAVGGQARVNANTLSETANSLFTGGTAFLDRLGGNSEGRDFLADRLDSGIADERIGLLQEDLGRFFREELLTGISRNSTGANTLGGSRQGVAESLAAREVSEQFRRGATDIRGAELDAQTAAAEKLLGFDIAGSQAALSQLPGLLALQEAGAFAELDAVGRVSDIIGGPTTLTASGSESVTDAFSSSVSSGFSRARSKGKSGGFSIGF